MGKSVGVVSLKGGVGKTSVVVALGKAIAKKGKKVLLVDGNLSAPNLGMHFKIINPEKSIHNVLARESHAKDAIHNLEDIDVIPGSIFTKKQVNPLKLKDRMSYLKRKYDYVIYDSSPSLGEETLGVMLASDGIVVVTTPDHPTLSTTIKAVNLAKRRGISIHGVVINKFHGKKFEIPLESVEDVLEVPVVAVIPHDVKVLEALSEFIPSVDYKPNSKASKEYMKLAGSFVGEEKKKGFWKRIFSIKPKRTEINRLVLYKSFFE